MQRLICRRDAGATLASWHGRPGRGKWELRKNRSAGFQPAEGPLKCNDLYAGETPALRFFTLCGMKSLAINSERASYLQVSHGRDARDSMASWHGRPGREEVGAAKKS